MNIGKFSICKREFFLKGDIVVDKHGNVYKYSNPVGFDKVAVVTENNEHIELNLTDDGPLTFHPDFEPGYICTDKA